VLKVPFRISEEIPYQKLRSVVAAYDFVRICPYNTM